MHISIWQQWASNHSASFTVIGEFESAEAANQAAKILRHILVSVIEWYERPENAEARARWEAGEEMPPTPPEIAFGKQYGVDWNEQSVDWIHSRAMVEEVVSILDNRVFVSSLLEETWLGPKPFDALMEKLGGGVQVTGEAAGGARQSVLISCAAPNEDVARSIHDECSAYFANPQPHPMPWQSYVDTHMNAVNRDETSALSKEEQVKKQNLFRAITHSQQELMRRFQADPQLLALQAEMHKPGDQQDRQQRNQLLMEYYQRVVREVLEAPAIQQALRAIDPSHMADHMAGSSGMLTPFGFAAQEGIVRQDGLKLEFRNVVFANIQQGLLAMVDFLKGKGCTEVEVVVNPYPGDE